MYFEFIMIFIFFNVVDFENNLLEIQGEVFKFGSYIVNYFFVFGIFGYYNIKIFWIYCYGEIMIGD